MFNGTGSDRLKMYEKNLCRSDWFAQLQIWEFPAPSLMKVRNTSYSDKETEAVFQYLVEQIMEKHPAQ
jgi:hypothetical protein